MSVNPISSSITSLLSTEAISAKDSAGSAFADIFTEALNTTNATDQADKVSALELLAGTSDDMSGIMLDAQKAEIALNLTLQLRNKALDAYAEIMRMQV